MLKLIDDNVYCADYVDNRFDWHIINYFSLLINYN